MILFENNQSIIEKYNNKVIKLFKQKRSYIDDSWLYHYNNFHNMYKTTVKIYEANCDRIVMDYVEGDLCRPYLVKNNNRLLFKYYSIILQNLSYMSEYSSNIPVDIGVLFFHRDAAGHNIVVNNDKYTLIDPDSFIIKEKPTSSDAEIITMEILIKQLKMKHSI